jgi:hypothetical protein
MGIAHVVFDHSTSKEDLEKAMEEITYNNSPEGIRYSLHNLDSPDLELHPDLWEELKKPGDYRIMNNDLREQYPHKEDPNKHKPLSEHKYVIRAESEGENHEVAQELGNLMNKMHLHPSNKGDPRVFRGAIIHLDEKDKEKYHLN